MTLADMCQKGRRLRELRGVAAKAESEFTRSFAEAVVADARFFDAIADYSAGIGVDIPTAMKMITEAMAAEDAEAK